MCHIFATNRKAGADAPPRGREPGLGQHLPVAPVQVAQAPMRSGRCAAVRRSAMSRRQRAIAAWLPDSSTSGTSRSRQARGRV